MTTSPTNNSVFMGFFEKQKLTGPNFIDWYRQLRIVLSIEDKLNYLEQPIPPAPVAPAGQQVAPKILTAHSAWVKGSKEIAGLMLMTMEPEIQRNLEPLYAHEMLKELKTLFAQQAEQEILQTTRDFHSCRQEEGQSVSSYILKMKGYIDNLECLGHPVTLGLGVSLILISLRKKYDGFVQNYNMHIMGKTVNELHAMLKLHEQTLPKSNASALNAIRAGKVQKGNKHKKSHFRTVAKGQNHRKGKNKQAYAPKPKIPPPPKRENPAKDSIYHECIFVIELNTILNRSWIYDTGCGRKLKSEALSLYVGNGQCEAVEAIRAFYLYLPSRLEIILNNYHYAPSITRGVISVSRLYEDGFVNRFINNAIQVSRNNVVYFCTIPRDGIFEIDLFNSLTNESSVYAVSHKRAKLDLDSALWWHCRLGHISKKHIEKLQHDGLLNSSDLREFEKCDHGIIAHHTPPYTPQYNGVSERRNRTLLDMVRSMMSQTTLPRSFWDYALKTAVRILNMVSTKKVEKTPYEVWHGKAPNLSYLKVWGCEALVKRDTLTKPDKLEPRSIKCIFVGYPKETYQEASGSLEDLEIIQEEDTHPSLDTSLNHEKDDLEIDEPQSDITPICRSTRTRHASDCMCLYIDAEEHELGDLGEPANYKAALLDPDKWLFKKKTDMDGNVHIYKARLVAKGFTQTPGIDYEETFSPVADIRTFRILIAIAAYYDYEIWQMDVKTAFLKCECWLYSLNIWMVPTKLICTQMGCVLDTPNFDVYFMDPLP
nr:zinc finger, CCHC-type [Tanacetum cinerariifolium]